MLNDQESKRFVIDAENMGRKILTGVFISLNGFPIPAFIWVTVCNFLLNFEDKQLMHKMWIPWNWDKVWVNVLTNVLLAVVSIPCLAFFVGIHFVEISFTLYISAYIKTLQNKLINKGIRNEGIYEQHKVIIQLIKDHNEVLSGIKYLETQISPLMPCGFEYIFIRAIKKNEITKAVDFYFRAMLGFLPSIISCCCGQLIITQLENLHQATYMTNWYDEEITIRKTFLTMMIRTTKPSTLNYRLFISFDHVLLGLVLQTVYSYMMLIVNLGTE